MEETDEKNTNKIEKWLNTLNTLTSQDELIVTCKVSSYFNIFFIHTVFQKCKFILGHLPKL